MCNKFSNGLSPFDSNKIHNLKFSTCTSDIILKIATEEQFQCMITCVKCKEKKMHK